jgi:TctA family transporter
MSQGNLGVFITTPLAGAITTLSLVMLFWPLIGRLRQVSRG